MSSHEQKRGGFGCLPYGCFIALCLIVMVGGGIAYLVVSNIRGAVQVYTADKPGTVPSSSMSASAAKDFQGKLAEISRVANDDASSGELTLSNEDIAALIAISPFNGKVTAQLAGDTVSAQFALKMRDLGSWGAGQWLLGSYLDRYVNGAARATLGAASGRFSGRTPGSLSQWEELEDAALKGASQWVSGAVDAALSGSEQAGEGAEMLRRIEAVWIADGVFHLKVGPLKR